MIYFRTVFQDAFYPFFTKEKPVRPLPLPSFLPSSFPMQARHSLLATGLTLTSAAACLSSVALAASSASSDNPQSAIRNPKSPNLVLIIADDCTKYDTQLYGGQAFTPNMMRISREGMTFSRCYQSAPICSPTRHALMTSKGPVKTGAYPNHTFAKPGITAWTSWLKAAGYRAALSGKTHVHPSNIFNFEYIPGAARANAENGKGDPNFTLVENFLKDCVKKGRNFGLYICSHQPHEPWNMGDRSRYPDAKLKLPPNFVDGPATRDAYARYLAEVTYYDGQVGQMLDLLDKYKLADNTFVIVLTEQGYSFPFAKWTCYDIGVASGMVIRWPGHVKAGSASDALVEYVDLMPTFCEAAGIKTPGDLDGRSFLALLEGKTNKHKDYTFSIETSRGIFAGPEYYGIRSVRDIRYRYILNLTPQATFKNTNMQKPFWKEWVRKAAAGDKQAIAMTRLYQHRPAEELYDVENDPWCMTNLIADPSLKPKITELKQQLAAWMKDQGDNGQATELLAKERLWKNADGSDGE